MERIYEVEYINPYELSIKEIENIEDCPDEFMTQEEILEMTGDKYFSCYSYTILEAKVRKDVKAELRRLKGKKSVRIENRELAEFLADVYDRRGWSVADCGCGEHTVKGEKFKVRRLGAKLMIVPIKKKVVDGVTFKHWKGLVELIEGAVNTHLGIDLDIKKTQDNRMNTINVIKKMVTWDEIEAYLEANPKRHFWNYKKEDHKWVKELYEDPALAPEVKKKK